MDYIPLGGSEKTHFIFEGRFPEHLNGLSASDQRSLLGKLRTIATEDAPPDGYIYEKIGNLDIIQFSSAGRIYSKVVTYIPEGNTQYHVVYILYVDEDHEYDQGEVGRFSHRAQSVLEEITNLETVDGVERYLSEHNSLTGDDLTDLMDGAE